MLKHFTSILIAFTTAVSALAWGQKGHDVTAAVAERHLTSRTAAAIDSLLDGRSMIYWANWLDNASHTPDYAFSKTWHYKNINEDETYETAMAAPAGDAVTAIKKFTEILTGVQTDSRIDSVLALKMLIHIVGDIHQPMHMGHATDLGGNRINVNYFGKPANLHSVWDSSLPESARKWSYSEWVDQIDRLTPYQQEAVITGTVDDWAKQTVTIAKSVYIDFPEQSEISYDHVARWTPVIEQQFEYGGLRLAHILNTIFDPEYAKEYPFPLTASDGY